MILVVGVSHLGSGLRTKITRALIHMTFAKVEHVCATTWKSQYCFPKIMYPGPRKQAQLHRVAVRLMDLVSTVNDLWTDG